MVQHKIFQKYQKSNLGHATFLMKLSYFEIGVEIVYFYELNCLFQNCLFRRNNYLISMFEFIITMPIWKMLLEKFSQNPLDSNTTKNDVKWRSKHFLCATPGYENVVALQKSVRTLKKKHNISY